MKQFVVILLLVSGSLAHVRAQSFLGNLKEKAQGEGTVTVIQSADIDELVNNARLNKAQNTSSGKSAVGKDTAGNGSAGAQNVSGHGTQASPSAGAKASAGDSENQDVNRGKKVMANTHKVTGYRIQAYSGGNSREDRLKAEHISSAIKARYPEIPVYVHFYSPRWICRVGNFRTYEEAAKMLKEIKGMGYTQACIVKGKINVRY